MVFAHDESGRRHPLDGAHDGGALDANRIGDFPRRLTVSLPETFQNKALACMNAVAFERRLGRRLERSRDAGHHVKEGGRGLLFWRAGAHRMSSTTIDAPSLEARGVFDHEPALRRRWDC